MMTFDEYQATMPMPIGPKLDNPHFTGDVWLIPLVTGNDVQTQMVTFAPGCVTTTTSTTDPSRPSFAPVAVAGTRRRARTPSR